MKYDGPLDLEPMEKLRALAHRFYMREIESEGWVPAPGDLYTTSRADLELYLVVAVDRQGVTTSYLPLGGVVSFWKHDEFLNPTTFGANRIHVPDYCFKAHRQPKRGEG